jgi:PAS domain S-box-containing protein
MRIESQDHLKTKVEILEARIEDYELLIEAIKSGEVDAFAVRSNDQPEVYTLQSGDYAYRVLIEEFGEGALNLTEDGLIVYTNTYFCELIGIPYEKVVGCSIEDFVHPDYKPQYHLLWNQALKDKAKGEIFLQANNRVIPVYVSLTSLKPKLETIGMIVSDLTEKKKAEYELLQANEQLAQSNAELASFTYVASHDLQEPLRKIETFCNRILEKEKDNFSEVTQDYFKRVVSAASRMKNLIHALLDYSQANSNQIDIVPTDLNFILEEVRANLSEFIADNRVVIESSGLPTLKVIPLQFNQLFLNIITNSIKYRRKGIDPKISIKADLINSSELPEEANMKTGKCWRICITDNGIGFEQQYSNQIFELFQRLHGKAEYEGTGIGLAICKKIVLNHNGFIRATGAIGVGSVFEIFLPQNS